MSMGREVDVSDIKDTTAELSQEAGQGEGTMTYFIKNTFNNILKPFAQQVEDLQHEFNRVNHDLAATGNKVASNTEQIGEHQEKISSLQKDLNRTTKTGISTQTDLEKLTAEKNMLEEDYSKTKADLKETKEALLAAQSAIAELQMGLKGTRTSTGKLRDSISKMEMDTASRIWPTIEQTLNDVKKLDIAHSTTALKLHETKIFTDNFHQAFQTFQEENDQRHVGHDRKFQQVEDTFTKVERNLKDVKDLIQLQSEHLNNIDASMGPVKNRIDNLEVAREEQRRKLSEHDRTLSGLKVTSSTMAVDVAKLIEFYEEAKSGTDVFELVGNIERNLNINANNIKHLLETTEDHTGHHRKTDNRTQNLEKAVARLQDLSGRMQDRIGLSAETPPPGERNASPAPDRAKAPASVIDNVRPPAPSGGAPRMPPAVFKALDKMSLAAKQKRINDAVDDHADALARSQTNIAKTASDLENTEYRVSVLESKMVATQEDVQGLRQSLDLSHEYWRGLSRGFKDMNSDANMDGKVLPPRANLNRLPAIGGRPSSRQPLTARPAI